MNNNLEIIPNGHRANQPGELDFPVKRHSSMRAARAGSSAGPAMSDWQRAAEVLRKHWRGSSLFAAAVILSVTLYTLLAKPVYEPSARLEIDPPGAELIAVENSTTGGGDEEYLETQAKNLQGDELAIAVIRELRLDLNPMIVFPGLASLAAVADEEGMAPTLNASENAALRAFHSQFKVQRDTAGRLITVSFASPDAKLSATVTNTTLQRFITMTYAKRHESIVRSAEWLSAQMEDVHKKMEASNLALADFQKKTGIASIDESKSTVSEQLADLARQKVQAQSERIQLESVLKNVQAGNPEALTQVHSNPVVLALTQKLAETRAELSQSLVFYGPNHPSVKKLESQASELENQIKLQSSSILRELKTSYATALNRERAMSAEMKATNGELSTMAEYTALKKEAETDTALYNDLYKRIKEAGIAAGAKASDMRIVDRARVLDHPTRPHRLLNIAAGMLAGLLGGVFLAFVQEGFDKRLYKLQDLQECVGISSVSFVPAIAADLKRNQFRLMHKKTMNVPEKFLLRRPASPESEALRGLNTSIMLARRAHPAQVTLIASSVPGEGKTTIAVNLAISLAQHGETCVVDADMRRSRVASSFGLLVRHGLSDVLRGIAELDESLIQVPNIKNLTVLPAGDWINPGSMINSVTMREVIESLRQRYEFIIIDSAPVLPYADGRVLSTLADGIIFVCRSGVTTREALARSLELLRKVRGAPILEVVMNGLELSANEHLYYDYQRR